MKIIYHSAYADEELKAGEPIKVIPSIATISVKKENGDSRSEVYFKGEMIENLSSPLKCGLSNEVVVKQGDQKNIYSVKPLVDSLKPEYAKAYEQFFYEYTKTKKNEIDSIRDGLLKLYAVDKSTEVYDWTDIFKKIEDAYPAFKAICEKPKSHLKSSNEVRPIETVKRIGYESIPYLAAHSEDWLARTASGLKPARLFSRIEDDDYQIYENRVVKTLVDLNISFLRKREKELNAQRDQLRGIINSGVQTGSFGFDVSFQKAVAELIKSDSEDDTYRSESLELAEKLGKKAHILLKKYRTLKSTRLYNYLKRSRVVSNPLNETNILLIDKHYSVIFKLWKSIHKVLIPRENIVEYEESVGEDFLNYKQFCATLTVYAAHVLQFKTNSKNSYFREDDIGIKISDQDGFVEVVVSDISKHTLDISGGIEVPLLPNSEFKKFYYGGHILSWSNDISSDEIDEFAALFKTQGAKGSKEQNEGKRKYVELKHLITDKETTYGAPSENKVAIIPMMIELKSENRNQFEEYVRDKALKIIEQTGAIKIIIALPKVGEDEQKVVDYAFYDDERIMFLPLSMYDINSFRRMQNVLLRQIIELNKDKCPYCGGSFRKAGNRNICDNCNQLIVTLTVCPEEDCHHEYKYISYDVPESTIEKMGNLDVSSFYQKDSLFQYKNIVKMVISENKIKTVCPHCHR